MVVILLDNVEYGESAKQRVTTPHLSMVIDKEMFEELPGIGMG